MFQIKFIEKIKTHFVFSDFYLFIFFFENRALYEIMWKNIVETDRSQMTICRMRIACWITKATDTLSEYVILTDLPLQQWLHERASVIR
jgi:hypothetical protein